MQKKIIALAIAGLVSGAAFAQSNVVIYGIADMGYVYADDFAGASASAKDTKAIHKIYSGGQSGSRLGFKGTEDLGNGLAANFRFESGINLDNGGAAQNGGTFSRWATVGLSGKNWGDIEFGRRNTISNQLLDGFDVIGRVTIAQASPIMKNVARWDNAATYSSPVWSGFQLKLQASTNVSDGQATAPTGANYKSEVNAAPIQNVADANKLKYTNVRGYAASATYVNGGLKLGGHYDYYDPQNVDNSNYETADQWTVVGSYNFGFANIGVQYGEISYGQNVSGLTSAGYSDVNLDKRKQWTIGAMIPVSPKARVSLMYAEGEDQFVSSAKLKDQDNSMFGIAAYYDLSKRTNLYAAYGDISQDQDNKVLVGLDGQDKYQKAFQVGIRHLF